MSNKADILRLLAVGPDGSNHQSLYTRLCEEAQVIIWACGYEASLSYSIVDANDAPLPIYLKRGQVEINDLAQVQVMTPVTTSSSLLSGSTSLSPTKDLLSSFPKESPVPICNLLATGLGFGLNVAGDTNSALNLCKADGVAVYLKRAATIILSHVLGPKVFGDGLLTWEQHVVENVRRWNEQQAQLRALKNQAENSDLEDSDLDLNSSMMQPGILSPIHPSKGEKRSVTPSHRSPTGPIPASPLITSPIRRQIRTAAPGEYNRKKTRDGSQVGVINSTLQKKGATSPATNSSKKPNVPPVVNGITAKKSGFETKLPLPTVKTDIALDNSDTDPFDLYLSGVASSLDGSDNQQNIPPQFSPLQSPKITLHDTVDCDESDGGSIPPPPYSLEEISSLSSRPTSHCLSTRDRHNSAIEPTPRPHPVSLSTPITPRSLLIDPLAQDLTHHPRIPTGWVAPTPSAVSPTINATSSPRHHPPSATSSLTKSVPEKSRSTFSSPRPNTLHLSTSILTSQRPTQVLKSAGISPFHTSAPCPPHLSLRQVLNLHSNSFQL